MRHFALCARTGTLSGHCEWPDSEHILHSVSSLKEYPIVVGFTFEAYIYYNLFFLCS